MSFTHSLPSLKDVFSDRLELTSAKAMIWFSWEMLIKRWALARLNPSLPPCQSSYSNFQVTRLCEAVGWGEELAQVEVETLEALVQGQAWHQIKRQWLWSDISSENQYIRPRVFDLVSTPSEWLVQLLSIWDYTEISRLVRLITKISIYPTYVIGNQ